IDDRAGVGRPHQIASLPLHEPMSSHATAPVAEVAGPAAADALALRIHSAREYVTMNAVPIRTDGAADAIRCGVPDQAWALTVNPIMSEVVAIAEIRKPCCGDRPRRDRYSMISTTPNALWYWAGSSTMRTR